MDLVIKSMFERLIEDAISRNIDEKERIDYESLEKNYQVERARILGYLYPRGIALLC